MRHRLSLPIMVILTSLVLVTAGCGGTQPSRFYSLASMAAADMAERKQIGAGAVVVAVGPVNIPDYLDRPQIVTRTGNSELRVEEFERWAGSLKDSIPRIVARNLSALLPPGRFTAIPWKPVYGMRVPVSYRVALVLQEFDGIPGGKAVLRVTWAVSKEEDPSVMHIRESAYEEDVGGNDFASLVEAMSRALGRMSTDIAAVIETLPRKEAASEVK